MAQLDQQTQQLANAADTSLGGGFEPLPPGKYVGRFADLEVRYSAAGNEMWVVEFDEIHDLEGNRKPGRQWYTMVLPNYGEMPPGYRPRSSSKPPEEAWAIAQNIAAARLKKFFDAAGYTLDSDTDEMVGERFLLQIGVRTIQGGARQGERTNTVTDVSRVPAELADMFDREDDVY